MAKNPGTSTCASSVRKENVEFERRLMGILTGDVPVTLKVVFWVNDIPPEGDRTVTCAVEPLGRLFTVKFALEGPDKA